MTRFPEDRLNSSADRYQEIQEMIAAAIAAEREACATIAATHIPGRARGVTMPFGIAAAVKEAAHQIAAAIRARGTET